MSYVTCITIIDTITHHIHHILTNYTNDAYYYDTWHMTPEGLQRRGGLLLQATQAGQGMYVCDDVCFTIIHHILTKYIYIYTTYHIPHTTPIHDTHIQVVSGEDALGAAAPRTPHRVQVCMYHNNRHNYTHLYCVYTLTTPINMTYDT
jgi:hypothetical protein